MAEDRQGDEVESQVRYELETVSARGAGEVATSSHGVLEPWLHVQNKAVWSLKEQTRIGGRVRDVRCGAIHGTDYAAEGLYPLLVVVEE